MDRIAVTRVVEVLLCTLIGYALWCLAYEVVVAWRFAPTLYPGEGSSRWALLKAQQVFRWPEFFTLAMDHFWARFWHPATRTEAVVRAGLALLAVVAAVGAFVVLGLALRKPTHYGNARMGTLRDAEKKHLLARKGLILGRLNGATLISDDPSHVLVVGPTRSGKGVSFVIPNGYMWRGSSVWFDPKRENYEAFGAHRRALGDKVFMFSPGERETHCYNPLDFIRRDARMPTDAAVVASFIIPEGQGSSEIWARVGRQLLTGLIGYVVASPRYEGQRHLRAVANLTATGVDFLRVLTNIRTDESEWLPSWVVQTFNQFIALEKETRNSAFFNVTAALNLWTNDLVAAATSRTDFDVAQLRREPMAIFIGCSVAQIDVLRPIIKMLIQQIHDVLMTAIPGPDEPHQVLVMIDEFRQLGKMDSIVSKLTINAGYGFRMVLVLQDLAQLDELYGKPTRETTVSACQVKLFIRMNDRETSEYVSEMLGTTTIEVRTPIIRGGQGLFASRDRSVSYQERPLRLAEELRQMPSERAIVLVPNAPGFELRKLAYYRDRPFKAIHGGLRGRRLTVPSLAVWSDRPLRSLDQVRAAAEGRPEPTGVIELAEPEMAEIGAEAAPTPTQVAPGAQDHAGGRQAEQAPQVVPPREDGPERSAGPAVGPHKERGAGGGQDEASDRTDAPRLQATREPGENGIELRPRDASSDAGEQQTPLPTLTSRAAVDSEERSRPPIKFERRPDNGSISLASFMAAADEAIARSEAELVPAGITTPAARAALETVRRKVRRHGEARPGT